ncbi:acetate--CoA ligase family protein [Sporichthya sp.]|uniref:acetate--CoA ligase family protein n=1 Tax=Sporichthya sp. TaxID=65475 RepID=UPI001799CF64|nr:acetate--CoA ligase family protein [Sporichthya sp.]MBA3741963.1 acetate--CoA ligase family protein [Sporichthya sp.]
MVVIGATDTPGAMTSAPVRNLVRHGYSGQISVVNPRRDEVCGFPCYAEVIALPEVPDTAVLVVGAARVPQVLRQCAEHGIRTATVIAGGFDEGAADAEGERRGTELRELLRETGLRLLGPNTAGLVNLTDSYVPRGSLNHPADLPTGRVGIVTQSGGLCNIVLNRAGANGVGVAMAVATGNQLDLDLWDLARYMLDDDGIDVIVMVVEGFKSPAKFVEVALYARAVRKPIVLHKLGSSDAGRKMVATHSGALAGAPDVQRAVMAELGVIQVDDIDQLWEVASLVTAWGPPVSAVKTLGVITLSGGDGAILADVAGPLGITLPEPTPLLRESAAKRWPGVHVDNPFDSQAATAVTGRSEWPEQVAAFADDTAYDVVLLSLPVLATPDVVPVIAPHLQGLSAPRRARTAVSMWTAGAATEPASAVLRACRLPTFASSDRAIRAIATYGLCGRRASLPLPVELAQRSDPGPLVDATATRPYWTSRQELAALGVPLNDAVLVSDHDAAVEAARVLGYPVTVKLSSTEAVHKADAGGVFLGLRSEAEVGRATESILRRGLAFGAGEGIVIEAHIDGTLPAFIGGHRDPEFGPIVLAGLGGGFVEPYADIARATCPADRRRIESALADTTFGRMLARRAATLDSFIDLVVHLSSLFAAQDDLVSFDVNPLLVRADGSLVAVDARTSRKER